MIYEDIYEGYKKERYIHYRLLFTGEHEIVPSKRIVNNEPSIINVRKPILEKQKISFEDIKELSLDDYGQDVRTCAEDFTLIHNYLFDYWGAIMGTDAVSIYQHLKRYCYGKRDYCFPDMEMIQLKMKKGSRNTIIKGMNVLEDYGFITKIYRKDKERNNADASPFFKIRKYVPLLSQDLINLLPEKLRNEHDKFMAQANGIVLSEHVTSKAEYLEKLMSTAEVMKSKSQIDKEKALIRKGKVYEYIVSTLNDEQLEVWHSLLHDLSEILSKPSFETWFSKTIILYSDSTITVVCQNEFSRDWINERYKNIISDIVRNKYQVDIPMFSTYLYDEFI